ncbi:MAG: transcriptional repressor [Victivallales bacterium]|nr:transcriptional repressor [Victivallales bacterium]
MSTAKEIQHAHIYDVFTRHGLRASEQRIVIYDYLLKNRIHPGAEAIYRHLHKLHPSLSLTTVYNTMKAFHTHGMVTLVTIEGGEVRYDVNTDFHAHFKCTGCGKLFDMPPMQDIRFLQDVPEGFEISATHVDLYGLCSECSKAEKTQKQAQ